MEYHIEMVQMMNLNYFRVLNIWICLNPMNTQKNIIIEDQTIKISYLKWNWR